ncbi:hypothetical protein PR003_g1906 [Phytophthora rubi]|uniref:Uncharacterized protein n=2 Tax=Phytophthora TaxID=4783 RepID=A0A6A4G820_9STRA|nr:hypothetical protein PR003_g1906 [Phytophthora rubi]
MRAPWLAAAQPFQNTAAVDPGLIVGRRRDIRSLLPKSVMSGTPHNGALFEHAVWQCALNSLMEVKADVYMTITDLDLLSALELMEAVQLFASEESVFKHGSRLTISTRAVAK